MTPSRDKDAEGYEVGYGKPPARTRFQSGRSGNPKGRPKGTKNLKTDLLEELRESIVVREGERAKTVPKQRAFVKMLMAQTLKGDTKAANLLSSMMWRLLDTGEAADDASGMFSKDEGREFARRVFDLAMRFVPEANREELLTGIEELLGIRTVIRADGQVLVQPISRRLPEEGPSEEVVIYRE